MPISSAMMAMTTSSSMSVNAFLDLMSAISLNPPLGAGVGSNLF
jgi:hypothetical protein